MRVATQTSSATLRAGLVTVCLVIAVVITHSRGFAFLTAPKGHYIITWYYVIVKAFFSVFHHNPTCAPSQTSPAPARDNQDLCPRLPGGAPTLTRFRRPLKTNN